MEIGNRQLKGNGGVNGDNSSCNHGSCSVVYVCVFVEGGVVCCNAIKLRRDLQN